MTITNFPNGLSAYGAPVMPYGIPFGPTSNSFFVDPANGNNGNDGLTPLTAVADLATAYAKTVTNHNDVIYFIGGPTATNPSTAIAWSNSYTHLVGLSSPLPGVGQRCRVVGTAANDLAQIITVSGNGCIFANIQFFNGKDADSASGAAIVSGSRNSFVNCFFAGMGHATPAARTDSFSLKVTGSENFFERCTIGLDTIIRAAANAELWLSTGNTRNRFWDCDILSHSDTATKLAVLIDDLDRFVEFKDCLFHNFSTNWSQALDNAISVTENTTYYIILRGNCQFVGFTGIADTVTHVYGSGPAPNAGMFLSTQPTT